MKSSSTLCLATILASTTLLGGCNAGLASETTRENQFKFNEYKSSYILNPPSDSVVIPFELFGKNIRMSARVNGQECNVLLDNGSLWDDLLFFGSPNVDSLNLNIVGITNLGNSTAETASAIDLEFEGLTFTDQQAVILPYVEGLPNPWEGADLQVSSAFFKNFVVEINFDHKIIRLTKPEAYDYRGNGEVIDMTPDVFESRTSRIEIETHDGKIIELDLLLDLGGLFELYLPVGDSKEITLPPDAELKSLGTGGFGASEGYIGTVKEVRIGKYRLTDVEAAFVDVEAGESVYGNAMIGFPMFQRFNITFDYFNERMILEPSMMHIK